jgi:RNA polymerase sigma factor (sigma-70 family)
MTRARNTAAAASASASGETLARALDGDRTALTALVERYLPLVHTIARGYRLNDADTDDVGQTVFLRLLEHLDRIREPRALPKWIMTTARHESLRLSRSRIRTIPVDELGDSPSDDPVDINAGLVRDEQGRVLRAGLARLTPLQRDLLLLLTDDQARSYREIGALLAIPIGSIGPTRARSLAQLRATPAVRSYLDAEESPQRRSA